MKLSVNIEDCALCVHRNICKYKDKFNAATAEIHKDLEQIITEIVPECIKVTINCKQYKPEYIESTDHLYPYIGSPYVNDNNPYKYEFDPYKLTCTNRDPDGEFTK